MLNNAANKNDGKENTIMKKHEKLRRILVFVSIFLALCALVPATYAYLNARTNSLVGVFRPLTEYISGTLVVNHDMQHSLGDDYVVPEDLTFTYTFDFESYMEGYVLETSAGVVTPDENGIFTVSASVHEPLTLYKVPAGIPVTVTRHPSPGFTLDDGASSKKVTTMRDQTVSFDFSSTYAPASVSASDYVQIKGEKTIFGRDWKDTDNYTLRLDYCYGENGLWQTAGTTDITYSPTNGDFNKFDFIDTINRLTFDKTGVYYFRLTEDFVEGNSFYRDKSEKLFKVVITDSDMNGVLEIADIVAGDFVRVEKYEDTGIFRVIPEFSNLCVPSDGLLESAIAKNEVIIAEGSDFISSDKFSFVITDVETGDTMTVQSDKGGISDFPLIYGNTDVGKTYHYQVKQVVGNIEGATYSEEVYDVVVTVYRDETGKIATKLMVDGADVDTVALDFTTYYDSDTSEVYAWPIVFVGSMIAVSCASWAITATVHKKKRIKKKS